MKIGIVLHPYGEDKPGGLPRMILSWTRALLSYDSENEYIIFLKDKPKAKPDLPGDNWTYHVLGQGRMWLDRLKDAPQADVYLFNTPVLPMFFRVKKSVVISLDYPYKTQQPKSLHEWKMKLILSFFHKRSLRRADHIVAISQAAKEDTVNLFGIDEKKITLVPHGYTDICALNQTKIPLPEKFFLFVGTLKERKNVMRIVQAYHQLKQSQSGIKEKLVIAGKKTGAYYDSLVCYVEENHLKDDVIFLGHVNDNQLSYIYRRATALVFPSLIEATGNPIMEAMYCGIPVITSNINGPAELGSDGSAVLVDPYKTEQITDGMRRVLTDEGFRAQLVEKGHEQVKKFSWENAAKGMLDVIRKTVQV